MSMREPGIDGSHSGALQHEHISPTCRKWVFWVLLVHWGNGVGDSGFWGNGVGRVVAWGHLSSGEAREIGELGKLGKLRKLGSFNSLVLPSTICVSCLIHLNVLISSLYSKYRFT